MARPGKKRKVLFALEIIVLLLFIGGLYVYGQITTRLQKLEAQTPKLDQSRIETNQDVIPPVTPAGETIAPDQETQLTGYSTYALFGVDHRDKNAALAGYNSDTMIIASINNDTHDVKLVSVYRDTLLNVGSNDTYAKANAAYAYGGPEQAISMLNTNLDLNITGYATVNFAALAEIVDCLGGIDVPMSYAEIVHMNSYSKEVAEEVEKEYTPIEPPQPEPQTPEELEKIIGEYHLNGVQATAYCRIRYTSNLDMGRTERQRRVIQLIVNKAKRAGLTQIFDILDKVMPLVQTSVTTQEIFKLIPAMIGFSVDDTVGFPQSYKFSNVKGSIIVPTSLESNVIELHKFLYGNDGYTPSQTVLDRSAKILEIVGGAESLVEEAPPVTVEDENTADDNFVWQDPNAGNDYNNGYDNNYDNNYDNGGDNSGGGDGSYDPGTGDGDYSDGSGDGGYDPGTGDGGNGGYDPGTGDGGNGGYDPGTGDGGDGGYDPGTGDGGDGGYDPGYGDGGDGGYDPGYGDGGDGGYEAPSDGGEDGGDIVYESVDEPSEAVVTEE